MQTLNILDSQFSPFNALNVFGSVAFENNKNGLVLLEQLQTTLDLDKILNIFSMEAAKFVDFSGLNFKSEFSENAIRGSRKAKSEKSFELKINNEYIGILTYQINSPISLTNHKILRELHQYLVYPLKNALSYQQALLLARQDSLTDLGNRRYFDEQLKRAMHQAKRQQSQAGIIVCDLNKFKAINDTFGHPTGDKVLQQFSKVLKASVRDSDSVFRFGGDEFVILVEDASKQSLHIIEHRIENEISCNPLLKEYQVSCSIGMCFMKNSDTEASFFERADEALYQNKAITKPALQVV
jgi:diguanylate cyclase (GGDEF)-like protein